MRKCIASPFLVLISLSMIGCNALGTFDTPTASIDKYTAAMAKANSGDCIGARDMLLTITDADDKINNALGWAQLCVGGATASNIASSLLKYTSSSSNLTVVGTLARTMLPLDSTKLAAIASARTAFQNINDPKIRNVESAIANLVSAAAVLANQAPNQPLTTALDLVDIGSAACVMSDCTGAVGICTSAGVISDADVATFVAFINAAATALASSGAADLQKLVQVLQSGLLGAADVGRCYIYNNVIPAS